MECVPFASLSSALSSWQAPSTYLLEERTTSVPHFLLPKRVFSQLQSQPAAPSTCTHSLPLAPPPHNDTAPLQWARSGTRGAFPMPPSAAPLSSHAVSHLPPFPLHSGGLGYGSAPHPPLPSSPSLSSPLTLCVRAAPLPCLRALSKRQPLSGCLSA